MNKANKFNISKLILSLLLAVLLTSIVGCEQVSNLKDNTVAKFNEWKESDFFHEPAISSNNETATTIVATPIIPTTTKITPISTTTLMPVYKNPSWQELKSFLLEDKTDELPYIYPTFICQDFAEKLQHNAHKAGWRCGIVSMSKTGYDDPYKLGIASNAGHACNAFETTDKGLVYIDCTGWVNSGPFPADTLAILEIGQRQQSTFIFPNGGYTCKDNISIITSINIIWE